MDVNFLKYTTILQPSNICVSKVEWFGLVWFSLVWFMVWFIVWFGISSLHIFFVVQVKLYFQFCVVVRLIKSQILIIFRLIGSLKTK